MRVVLARRSHVLQPRVRVPVIEVVLRVPGEQRNRAREVLQRLLERSERVINQTPSVVGDVVIRVQRYRTTEIRQGARLVRLLSVQEASLAESRIELRVQIDRRLELGHRLLHVTLSRLVDSLPVEHGRVFRVLLQRGREILLRVRVQPEFSSDGASSRVVIEEVAAELDCLRVVTDGLLELPELCERLSSSRVVGRDLRVDLDRLRQVVHDLLVASDPRPVLSPELVGARRERIDLDGDGELLVRELPLLLPEEALALEEVQDRLARRELEGGGDIGKRLVVVGLREVAGGASLEVLVLLRVELDSPRELADRLGCLSLGLEAATESEVAGGVSGIDLDSLAEIGR